jgi:hypothetical protein
MGYLYATLSTEAQYTSGLCKYEAYPREEKRVLPLLGPFQVRWGGKDGVFEIFSSLLYRSQRTMEGSGSFGWALRSWYSNGDSSFYSLWALFITEDTGKKSVHG